VKICVKYKISIADKCGFETAKSPYHKTVNLGVSQGVPSSTIVLSWNDYVEETGSFVPDKYFIYRGTLPDNLTVLDSISASFTSYNDINVFSAYYYVIGVRKLGGCTASSSAKTTETYNEALSNLKDNGLVGVSKFNQNDMLNIYPNPFDDLSTIEFYNPENNSFKLTLTDLSGRFVKVVNNITGNKVIIDRKDLKAGVYLIELKGKERNYQGRIMIE